MHWDWLKDPAASVVECRGHENSAPAEQNSVPLHWRHMKDAPSLIVTDVNPCRHRQSSSRVDSTSCTVEVSFGHLAAGPPPPSQYWFFPHCVHTRLCGAPLERSASTPSVRFTIVMLVSTTDT